MIKNPAFLLPVVPWLGLLTAWMFKDEIADQVADVTGMDYRAKTLSDDTILRHTGVYVPRPPQEHSQLVGQTFYDVFQDTAVRRDQLITDVQRDAIESNPLGDKGLWILAGTGLALAVLLKK